MRYNGLQLSDGVNAKGNSAVDDIVTGYGFNSVKPVLKAYPYPIYTIAYGKDADTEELQRIADINGGVFVNSTTGDIGYLLKNIFSAEF